MRIPSDVVVEDVRTGPTWREYNALVEHAKVLRREALRQQCYKHAAERDARCAWERVKELQGSWMPGRLVPGRKCTIPEPTCLEEFE